MTRVSFRFATTAMTIITGDMIGATIIAITDITGATIVGIIAGIGAIITAITIIVTVYIGPNTQVIEPQMRQALAS